MKFIDTELKDTEPVIRNTLEAIQDAASKAGARLRIATSMHGTYMIYAESASSELELAEIDIASPRQTVRVATGFKIRPDGSVDSNISAFPRETADIIASGNDSPAGSAERALADADEAAYLEQAMPQIRIAIAFAAGFSAT